MASLWVTFQRWINRPKFPIYEHPGGYAAWKNKYPPKTTGCAGIIGCAVLPVGLCAVVFFGVGFYSMSRVQPTEIAEIAPLVTYNDTPETTAESTSESEATDDPAPVITATLTPLPLRSRQTATPQPSPTGNVTTTSPTAAGATATLTPLPLRRVTQSEQLQTLRYLQLRETAISASRTAQPVISATRRTGDPAPGVTIVYRDRVVTVVSYPPAPVLATLDPALIVPFPTALPTSTPLATGTPTETALPEETELVEPPETPTATETPTETALPEETEPVEPSETPTATETPTGTPTETHTATFTPSFTPTSTPTGTGS